MAVKRKLASTRHSSTPFWHTFSDKSDISCSAPASCILSTQSGACVYAVGEKVFFFDPSNFLNNRSKKFGTDSITALCTRQDFDIICAGTSIGDIYLADLSVLRSFKAHQNAVRQALFLPNRAGLVTAGDDGKISHWDVATGSLIKDVAAHSDYIRSICLVSPQSLASGSYDHTIKLWDISSFGLKLEAKMPGPVEATAYSGDDKIYVSCSTEIYVLDVYSLSVLSSLQNAHQKAVTFMRCISDEYVCSSSLDGHVKVFKAASLEHVYTFSYGSPVIGFSLDEERRVMYAVLNSNFIAVRKRLAKSVDGEQACSTADVKPVSSSKKIKIKGDKYERRMRRFEYTEALDAIITSTDVQFMSNSILNFLRSGALLSLLGRVDEAMVLRFSEFCCDHLDKPLLTGPLCVLLNHILKDQRSGALVLENGLLSKLEDKLKLALQVCSELNEIEHSLLLLLQK